jgi:Lon protease-like protein
MVLDRWSDLPLFPLNTVLFPGMVLPLHIFEERYKLMIQRCLEEERAFGVVLIREGKEAGGSAVPYDVGTTALIGGVSRLEGGRMNIVTVGHERFRLRTLRRDLPYLMGSAEPWPLAGAETDWAWALVESVRALFQRYLDLLAQAQGDEIKVEELPTEPRAVALLVAIALRLPMAQKQRLLDQPTVARLLVTEQSILRREQLVLDHIVRTQKEQWEGGYCGFLAKN